MSDHESDDRLLAWWDGQLSTAIGEALHGDRQRLARLMRDQPRFSPYSWNLFADYLEGALDRPRGRPNRAQGSLFELTQPRPVELAADEFHRLMEVWKSEHKLKYRIRDKAIKEAAARHAVSFDTLNNYLRRGKPARKNR